MAKKNPLPDRREIILSAAVAMLRDAGYSGFTHPRVAKLAKVRQSHLTYYFPTRLALLEADARVVVENQLALLDVALDVSSAEAAIRSLRLPLSWTGYYRHWIGQLLEHKLASFTRLR